VDLDLDLDLPSLKRTWTRTWTCSLKVDLDLDLDLRIVDLDLDLDFTVAGLVASLAPLYGGGTSIAMTRVCVRLSVCSLVQGITHKRVDGSRSERGHSPVFIKFPEFSLIFQTLQVDQRTIWTPVTLSIQIEICVISNQYKWKT